MNKKVGATAAAVAMALAMAGLTAQTAAASQSGDTSRASLKAAAQTLSAYSDTELLMLLLAAQGPVATDHPALKRLLGFNELKPTTDERALAQIIDAYLAYDKSFHRATAVPLQSGDPVRVDQGLRTFSTKFNSFLASHGKQLSTQDQAVGRGWFYMGAYVAVYANALAVANAGVYANVGVATNALATLVIVTWYLEDGQPVGSEFERDAFIKSLTDALA